MCIYTYYISIELYILYIFIYIWYTYYIYIYVSKLCGHIFDVEPTVIDALLGSNELSSMHFWVSVELYRCSFGFKLMFIDVVFISFSFKFIDAPSVKHLWLKPSSMSLEIFAANWAFIDAPRPSSESLNMPSMYLEARDTLMNWVSGMMLVNGFHIKFET